MKKLILFSIFALLLALNACNRQKPPEVQKSPEKDSLLKALQKPIKLGPSEEEIKQLIETVKPQREKLMSTIDKLYPGLYKKYEMSVKEISKFHKKEDIKKALYNLDTLYKAQFTEAYNKSGIDESIRNVYKDKLSQFKYTIGDFGTLIISTTVSRALNVVPSEYTDNFNCPLDVQEKNTNCQGISADDATNVGGCFLSAGNLSLYIGGCGSYSKLGKNINVNGAYQNITSTFQIDYYLDASATAVGGGAYCEAMVGSEIDEGSTIMVQQQYSKVWVVAPFIWYAESSESKNKQVFMCSYNRSSTSSNFTATPKVYCQVNGGGGGNAGCVSFSDISSISSAKLQLDH
jgi:hypothetical protein